MICEKCGLEHEEKYCPVCRKNAVSNGIVALIKAAFYTIFFIAVQFAVQLTYVFVKAFSAILSGMSDADAYEAIMNAILDNLYKMTILSSLVTILAVGIFFLVRKRSVASEVRLNPVAQKHLGLTALFGAALQVVTSVAVGLVPWPQTWVDALPNFEGSESVFLEILAAVILAPITEELIFRGLVHTRLRRAFPPVWAAVLSGVAFGIVHGNIIQFLYAAVLGVVLALIMERYGSLLPCILIHIFFNGVSFLLPDYNEVSAGVIITLYLIGIAITVLCVYLIWFKKKDIQSGKELS